MQIHLPWAVADIGRYARFLEFDITSTQKFIDFVNIHKPKEELHAQKFFELCSTLAQNLEEWQDKPGEYEWIVLDLSGQLDED